MAVQAKMDPLPEPNEFVVRVHSTGDAELDAILICTAAVDLLPPAAARRIIQYVKRRIDGKYPSDPSLQPRASAVE